MTLGAAKKTYCMDNYCDIYIVVLYYSLNKKKKQKELLIFKAQI